MQIYRVLDAKVEDGEDIYLIQWLGDHRDSAEWQSKPYIQRIHPKQLVHLDNFDKKFARKCSEVRSTYFNTISRTTQRRASSKQVEESNEQSSIKANSTVESGETIRKKGNMTLRHGSDQVLGKAKTMMERQKSSLAIPSLEFKISICTEGKNQNHWAHKNIVQQIVEQRGSIYKIKWDDDTTAEFSQKELMEREPLKLCQYWQRNLGIWSSKKRKE